MRILKPLRLSPPRVPPAPRRRPEERGIALLIVMLLMLVLLPFAAEFSYQIQIESRTASNVSDQLKLDNAIDGQREIVLARIEYDALNNESDTYSDGWNEDEIKERSQPMDDRTDLQLVTQIWDEQGKFPLHMLATGSDERRNLWKKRLADLFRRFRYDTKYDASGLADELSEDIFRWMNGEGGRGDLPKPQTLADSPMLVLDELYLINEKFEKERILVDIEEGDDIALGLHRFVTIYGTGKINLNTAPLPVLQALFSADEDVAERIIERREGEGTDEEDADSGEESMDPEGAGTGNPFTDVNQVSEIDGVNLALLNRNSVDLNQDFDVKTNFFSMRIKATTSLTLRDELIVVERVPASDPSQPMEGFRFLLHQERTDALVDESKAQGLDDEY